MIQESSPDVAADYLVKPTCGCPFVEIVHDGLTVAIHAHPGLPISAFIYDLDLYNDLSSKTMSQAETEVRQWIETL